MDANTATANTSAATDDALVAAARHIFTLGSCTVGCSRVLVCVWCVCVCVWCVRVCVLPSSKELTPCML